MYVYHIYALHVYTHTMYIKNLRYENMKFKIIDMCKLLGKQEIEICIERST